MNEAQTKQQHHGVMDILSKTALLSWLTTIVTLTLFVAVILPDQKQTFLENLESKARGVSVSLQDIAAGAVVTEDYSEVVDHCMEVLSGDKTIEFLVLTRNDGFALIHTRDGWKNENLGATWRPPTRRTTHGINRPDILDGEVFQYSRPFDYSGIEWGWIHVGLSLNAFRANVMASYTRTAWLAVCCILMGLFASVIYAKRIVGPILRLRRAVQRVADGDLDVRAEVHSGDEVEALADAFNTMTQSVQDREARVRAQNQQLAALVTEKALHAGNILEAAARITEVGAETLGVEHVSVWLFDESETAVECVSQFTLSNRTHSRGAKVNKQDHPAYFAALSQARVLTVSDAFTDPRTASLTDTYLRPMNVSSLMDAAIRMGGRVAGVICHEHVGACREWTLEEENFAGSIADLLALALEARDRCVAQDELLAAKEAAEAASEAKSQFLANMSHEIRTPINGVMGMLQLMDGDDLSDKRKRYVTTALSSADTLLTVIGDVLDFSKIEAGHLELDHVNFALRDALDRSVRLFAETAEGQGLELSYSVSPKLPDMLIGDSNRLRQVLINLIGNAIKFTETGEVHLGCRLVERTETHAHLRFSVQDTGPGIPAEQCETIFQSFAQGDTSMRRRHGGTGLGLAICRHLVGLMGGEIGVDSTLGKGATFWFTACLELQEDAPVHAVSQVVDPRGLRVLVVDDSDVAREVVCDYIGTWGCKVGQAANASEAIDELRRAVDADTPYALALLDDHMPGIDGRRLARLVQRDPHFEATRLILLSGFSEPSVDRLHSCGIGAVVPKPVRASELYDAIVNVASGEAMCSPAPAPLSGSAGESPTGVRVLLVEDNVINQDVAREMICRLGHGCDCLNSGEAALGAMATNPYDIIFMDCQMPGMDGFEATAKIREWEAENRSEVPIPIVALTAHAMKGDRDSCLAAGMDDYLSKPLQAGKLAVMLAKWLGGVEVPATPLPESARAEKADREAAVVSRCSGNRALAARLLRDFVTQTAEDIATMSQALQDGDPERVAKAAHRLKGAAGNLALHASETAAAELEKLGRSGRIANVGPILAALQTEVDSVAGMAMFVETVGEDA